MIDSDLTLTDLLCYLYSVGNLKVNQWTGVHGVIQTWSYNRVIHFCFLVSKIRAITLLLLRNLDKDLGAFFFNLGYSPPEVSPPPQSLRSSTWYFIVVCWQHLPANSKCLDNSTVTCCISVIHSWNWGNFSQNIV